MSTTIDSLEIKIESDSSRAADGIEELSIALGDLKKNGTITTAVKNLNNLSSALRGFTSVTSNASKISSLATALKTLKEVGSLKGTGNSIEKMAASLKSLTGVSTVSLEKVANSAPLFERVAAALGKLSGVKPGGIGTMVNALAKIGDVTAKLDDDAINKFAERVSKLNEKLTPLSAKMTTIQAGLRGVNSSAKSAGTGVKNLGTKVNKTALNFASLTTVIQGVYSALQPVVRLLSSTISDAIEWDGISARFGRGFGAQAEEVYSWVQRLNEEMGINVQQFMQYSSTYATMLSGFGVAMEDASKMALGYTELTYDIWAGYNDIYKNYSDAADAVRSAIAGEVEPIRRAGFTIVESTLEQTAANYGLEISLENATEAQKSYLRYLTLVDQAHAQNLVGTYARELNTAEGLMRTFAQQVKSLAQAFGSLFLPILVKVMPWLQAFIDLLTEAVIAVAAFFGIEIQPVDWGGFNSGVSGGSTGLEDLGDSADSATGSLGDTSDAVKDTTKALKELKNATIGIDELNVISPPDTNTSGAGSGGSGSGGSGGGAGGSGGGFGGLDVDSLWDDSIFDQIQSRVDDIKEKLKGWMPVIELIGGALAGLGVATLLKHLGDALSKMNLLQKLFATVATVAIEAALVFTFADKYLESGNFLYLIGEALVTAAAGYLMFRAWGPGGAVLALSVSILAQIAAITMNLADGTVSLSSPELWTQALVTVLTGALGGAIIAKHTAFFAREGLVIGLATTLSLTMMGINYGAIESGEIDTNSFESWIMQAVAVAGAGMTGFTVGKALAGTASGGKTGLLIGVTVGLVLNLASIVGAKGDDFGDNASDWINGIITTIFSGFTAVKIWQVAGPTIKGAFSGLVGKVGGWLTAGGAATLFAKIEAVLASIPVWGWIAAAVVALLSGAIALAVADYDFTDIGYKLGHALGTAFKSIGDWFKGVGDWFVSLGKSIWSGIQSAFQWIAETFDINDLWDVLIVLFVPGGWIAKIIPGLIDLGKEILPGIWEGIKQGWNNLVANIKEFCDGFVQGWKDAFGIASPAKTMIPVGRYIVEGVWSGITGAYEWIKEKVLGWCENIWKEFTSFFSGDGTIDIDVSLIKKGWSTVKDWIGKIPGVSQAVSLAKSGWSTVKGWIGSIPGVSQAVSLAKSGWSSVKSWVGGIPKLSQTIGLVKSGWSSVTKWVGSMPKLNTKIGLIKSGWSSVSKWVGGMPTLKAKIGLAKSGWSSVKSWLGGLDYKLKFTLPKIKVNWGEKTVAGFTIKYPKGFSTYAKGGFPDVGEMFIAREAGPEMVGKIGNKTTVANNDQIVEGISEGVYAAVLAAMKASESNGSQSVNVYLDGKQILGAVEKRQHERGASLMGNQVYSY